MGFLIALGHTMQQQWLLHAALLPAGGLVSEIPTLGSRGVVPKRTRGIPRGGLYFIFILAINAGHQWIRKTRVVVRCWPQNVSPTIAFARPLNWRDHPSDYEHRGAALPRGRPSTGGTTLSLSISNGATRPEFPSVFSGQQNPTRSYRIPVLDGALYSLGYGVRSFA